MTKLALGIIDAQRGFMPAEEGERLDRPGFGELPASNGQRIIPKILDLMHYYDQYEQDIITTQDWHPEDTEHFSSFPVHCVANTAGAKLHPSINELLITERFYKGTEKMLPGDEDNSFSAFNAHTQNLESFPSWVVRRGIRSLVLAGYVVEYCLGSSALDSRKKMPGLEVSVVTDASVGLTRGGTRKMYDKLKAEGIELITTKQALERLDKEAFGE